MDGAVSIYRFARRAIGDHVIQATNLVVGIKLLGSIDCVTQVSPLSSRPARARLRRLPQISWRYCFDWINVLPEPVQRAWMLMPCFGSIATQILTPDLNAESRALAQRGSDRCVQPDSPAKLFYGGYPSEPLIPNVWKSMPIG